METMTREAAFLENAVCKSEDKQLHVHCHARSGKGWVQVGDRRFVGQAYVDAARRLHEHQKLALKNRTENSETFELGNHACSKSSK